MSRGVKKTGAVCLGRPSCIATQKRPAAVPGAPQRGEADAKGQEGARAGRKDEVRVVQRRLKPQPLQLAIPLHSEISYRLGGTVKYAGPSE